MKTGQLSLPFHPDNAKLLGLVSALFMPSDSGEKGDIQNIRVMTSCFELWLWLLILIRCVELGKMTALSRPKYTFVCKVKDSFQI